MAQFMVVLDASIVSVALPSIQTDLGFSERGLQWVVNAYTQAASQPWSCPDATGWGRQTDGPAPPKLRSMGRALGVTAEIARTVACEHALCAAAIAHRVG